MVEADIEPTKQPAEQGYHEFGAISPLSVAVGIYGEDKEFYKLEPPMPMVMYVRIQNDVNHIVTEGDRVVAFALWEEQLDKDGIRDAKYVVDGDRWVRSEEFRPWPLVPEDRPPFFMIDARR